ncbi:MAG: sulfurtransferase TusA family protein [Tepidiformaceae bacterium]
MTNATAQTPGVTTPGVTTPSVTTPGVATPAQIAETYIDSLQRHDHGRLSSVVAPAVELRALLPRGAEEWHGVEASLTRIWQWFDAWDLSLLDHAVDDVGGRWSVRFRFDARQGDDHRVIEQTLFCTIGDGKIETIDLLCSGFRPVVAVVTPGRYRFDAGDLGCADGLAAEFRRQLQAVPVGSVLEVVTHDPAAREDLPPLARMTGNTVLEVRNLEDGGTVVVVERNR